jgi:molybdenum-dependent DNA-binding transcriptional regulator ModE
MKRRATIDKDNLKIDYHREILVREAVRRCDSILEASKQLGVSDRTLHRYLRKYNL